MNEPKNNNPREEETEKPSKPEFELKQGDIVMIEMDDDDQA